MAREALELLHERNLRDETEQRNRPAPHEARQVGVVFYDSAGRGAWVVRTREGGRWPLKSAPVQERDCFVVFDEAHCRGADMRLRHGQAVLTLGPRMCKDALMQAAGRLRQLAQGQTLLLTALPEVVAAIRGEQRPQSAAAPSVADALRWVVRNTAAASSTGLLQFCLNGLHFAATRAAPELALEGEPLSLEGLYGGATEEREVAALVGSAANRWCGKHGVGAVWEEEEEEETVLLTGQEQSAAAEATAAAMEEEGAGGSSGTSSVAGGDTEMLPSADGNNDGGEEVNSNTGKASAAWQAPQALPHQQQHASRLHAALVAELMQRARRYGRGVRVRRAHLGEECEREMEEEAAELAEEEEEALTAKPSSEVWGRPPE